MLTADMGMFFRNNKGMATLRGHGSATPAMKPLWLGSGPGLA
jgi:hypothetical protein